MDMEDEYGPAPPISGDSTQQALTGFSVLKFLKQEMEARKTKKKRKKEKERDKDGGKRRKKVEISFFKINILGNIVFYYIKLKILKTHFIFIF